MSVKTPRLYIILLVRNAEETIIDWLSWHLALGVSGILVVDAGSTDGTKTLVQALEVKEPVKLLATTSRPDMPPEERRLLLTQKALELFSDKNDWVLFLDVDEYLCPGSSLPTFLKNAQKTGAMAIRWCLFGEKHHPGKAKGHLVAAHGWRADVTLPDHRFVRIMARLSEIRQPAHIKDPITLDIPSSSWITAAGKAWSDADPAETLWNGGRILHYICMDDHKSEDSALSSLMKRYYNSRHIRDITGFDHLGATRLVQNHLYQRLFAAGIVLLKKMIKDRQWIPEPLKERDLALPDKAKRFGFSYRRIRMSPEETRLISPQAYPSDDMARVFLLRTPSGAFLEADGEKDSPRIVLCLVQDRYPELATFFCKDRKDFTLHDVISFDHYAITCIRPTTRANLITLPIESGREALYFNMISFMEPQPPAVLPLPPYDEPEGLSLYGFLEWLSTHPEAQPLDIRRGLFLLTEKAARTLGQQIPPLQPFLKIRLSAMK